MVKRRKNYLPGLVLVIVLWGLLGVLIYWVEPELIKDIVIPGLYLPFFLLFFPASLLTLALLLNNSRKGLLISLGITIGLILRVYRLDNWLNYILILGLMLAIDRYLSS